jgi:two-component system response regulator DctR
VDRVEQALRLSAQRRHEAMLRQQRRDLLGELTERERDVMRLIVEGLPNKLIADQLNISVRTVEVHRARVFDKMGVKSAVELSNRLREV